MSADLENDGKPKPLGRFLAWRSGLDRLGRQRFYATAGLSLTLLILLIFPGRVAAPSAAATTLLLLTSHWWVRWAFVPRVENPKRIGRPISKLSILFLLGALILATCLRLPLMNRYILHGEQDNLSRNIHGYTDVLEDGSEEWRPVDWSHAFHENRLASNPILLSVTAKASLEIWRKFTGLPAERFHLVPVRLPSLVTGLASIFLIWRILHWFGYRCAALFAAFFLAIHPAAINFDVQACGYSLSIFFELIAIASIYLALRTLQWRYWILYGASILLCLLAHPCAVYFAIGISFFLSIYLLRRVGQTRTRATAWPQLVRFGIANTVAALVLLQLANPAIAQAEWIFCTWDQVVCTHLSDTPPLAKINLAVAPLLLIFGTVRLIRGNRFTAPLALGGLAAPALAYLHSQIATNPNVPPCNISYALPVFIMLFAIGITSLSDFFKSKKHRPYITLGIGAAYLITFSIATGSETDRIQVTRKLGDLEYVEFQGGGSRWRVYSNGELTRELGKKIDTSPHG